MKVEEKVINWIRDFKYEDLTEKDIDILKKQILTYVGCVIAGSSNVGCEEVVEIAKTLGGKEEATVLVHGGKVPAQQAAFVNGVMGRALDVCDHAQPGIHTGSGMISAVLAAAQANDVKLSGKEFMTALAVGDEMGFRFNLEEEDYHGFDPTGIAVTMACAAGVAKVLDMDYNTALHTMALAFNRCGGSFQCNIDGALGVRIIEGWVAQAGVECARLAQAGLTGPVNFLSGVYSYHHLFTLDRTTAEAEFADLGEAPSRIPMLGFKKFPSCGMTQGSTQLTLDMMEQYNIQAQDVERIVLTLPTYGYNLVGTFKLGDNPKVNAQFGTPYCIANALVRRQVKLAHFEPESILDDQILEFTKKIKTVCDPSIDHTRPHYASNLTFYMKDGTVYEGQTDISPGTKEAPLVDEDFKRRFYDCVDFTNKPFINERADQIYQMCLKVDELDNIYDLFDLITQ